MDILEQVQLTMNVMKGLDMWNRGRGWAGWYCSAGRRDGLDLNVLKHLIGAWKEDRIRLFLVVSSKRTRSNKYKMKYRKVHFKHKKIKKLVNYKDGWTLEQSCLKRLWSLIPWRYSNPKWTRSWASCSNCALSSAFRLDDLRGLFQYFRNSTILWKLMYSNFKLVLDWFTSNVFLFKRSATCWVLPTRS